MKQNRKTDINKEEYISLFCIERRIRDREVIYVSKEVHKRLKDIAFVFKFDHYTTLSSLADAILMHHTECHKDLINRLQKEFNEEFLKELSSSRETTINGGEDEYNDDETTGSS